LVIDSSNTKEHTQDGNALLQIKRLSRELENKNKALKGQLAKMRSNESYCAEQQKLRLDPGRDKSHTCCIGDIANSKEGATGDFDEKVQVEAAKMEQLKNSLLEKDEYIIKLETEMEELRNRIRYVSKKSRLEINKLKNRLDEIAFAKDAQAQEIASLKRKLFEKIHT
jgi:small-conductance mechanosensitive channel